MHTPSESVVLVDSHCHLIQLDLTDFNTLDQVLLEAKQQGVSHFLCVCITREDVPHLERIAAQYSDVSISVGVHPSDTISSNITTDELIKLGSHKACIAIGETGLDYYRVEEKDWGIQQESFRSHIRCLLYTSDAADE